MSTTGKLGSLLGADTHRVELAETRNELLHILLVAASIFGLPPVVNAVVRVSSRGEYFTAILYVLLYSLIPVAALSGRRLPFRVRSGLLLTAGYLMAFLMCLRTGVLSIGVLVLCGTTVITAVLHGRKWGSVGLLVGVGMLTTVLFLLQTGLWELPVDPRVVATSVLGWSASVLLYIMFSALLALAPGMLIRRLASELELREARNDELEVALNGLRSESQQRELAETAQLSSVQRFRHLVQLLPETVFEVDVDGKITYVNDSGRRCFGHTDQQLREGLTAIDLIAPADRVRAAGNIRQVLEGKELGVNEYLGCRNDGTTFPMLVRSAGIVEDGQLMGLRGVIVDISEKKSLEAELLQARKMEALGTLAGGIAHDFNNLLMGIQGRVSLALLEVDTGFRAPEHLRAIEECVESAAGLSRQLLGFAHAGQYEVRATQLEKFLDHGVQMFRRTHKALEVTVRHEEQLPSVEVDRNQLHQVLLNLLVNSAHAMPRGGRIEITTGVVNVEHPVAGQHGVEVGRYVQFCVRDTGAGIEPDVLTRVFEPFFTTKERGRGTGLGLASSYGIVRSHGGFITVESELDKGSEFAVHIPASGDAVRDEEVVEPLIARGCETVLLVDDEEVVLEVTAPLLEHLGYQVSIARGGAAALEVMQNEPPAFDIVILDMVMPGMSGRILYRHLRPMLPEARFLILSGYSLATEARELLELGCDGFLQKPFRMAQLSEKLREIVDGTKRRDDVYSP